MKKSRVGVIGATGMVGQNYIKLLENHPWFQVTYVAASQRSAGKKYREAVAGRWLMQGDIPEPTQNLMVENAASIETAKKQCDFIFSAVEIDKKTVREIENSYARQDIPVVSNNSAHRHTADVPMLIPEINADHLGIISHQKKRLGSSRGFIAVKPNCSVQSYMIPLYALIKAGYPIKEVVVTTLQALSGAGYPGVPSLDILGNVIPYINGEEEKSEQEPLKILGRIKGGEFVYDDTIKISANCNRVPVIDGHLACVNLKFQDKKPDLDEIKNIWRDFKAEPQELNLPFAPSRPIIYRDEDNRPQPAKDSGNDKGMAVTAGRLRKCDIFDFKFVGLSHNTVRGAAGGGILNAELLKAKGFLE